MKAYKVAKRCGENNLISVGVLHNAFKYTYRLDKVNKPAFKNSKFFVFKDLNLAETFRTKHFGEIWEVEVTNLKTHKSAIPLWSSHYVNLSNFENFWNDRYQGDLAYVTDGAYTCSSIDFVKRVL